MRSRWLRHDLRGWWIVPAVTLLGSFAHTYSAWGQAAADETTPVSASGSATTLLEWRGDNRNAVDTDDNFFDAIVRTQFNLDGGDVRTGLRFDAEQFYNRPAGVDRRNDQRIERVNLDVERSYGTLRLSLTLGDFYAQFGRGLVLSLRRVDELGLDIAARGARTDVSFFDDSLTLTLLGGQTNAVNIETQRLRYTDDPQDLLAGARLELHQGATVLAVHGVGLKVDEPNNAADTANFGGTFDATVGLWSFGLEVDGQRRTFASQSRNGLAAYATATARLARTSVLVELKHYDKFEPLRGRSSTYQESPFLYSFSPTAERIDQELLDNTDITGGRLKLDFTTNEDTASSVFVSGAGFRSRFADQWFAHTYGGIDQRWQGGVALLLSVGYRREWAIDGGDLARAIAHGELDLLTPLRTGYALHLIVSHQTHVEALGASRYTFERGNASVELDVHTKWVAVGGFDWNTQSEAPGVRKGFGYGVLRFRASDTFSVQLFAGSQRGGIRCVAGACRDFPPFSGARIDTAVRF